MASARKAQGEMVLGARHVLGVFLGIVVLCGMFFALGYVMGRDQSRASLRTAATAARTGPSGTAETGASSVTDDLAPGTQEWDFFPRKNSTPGATTEGAPPGGAMAGTAAGAAGEATRVGVPPAASNGDEAGPTVSMARTDAVRLAVLKEPPAGSGESLQVAALTNASDALALAEFLRRRGYPAFVWGPAPDRLYRVQVGPFPDSQAAEQTRRALEREGFKTIRKH